MMKGLISAFLTCLKNPKSLKVRIKASKTDPFRVGVDIYVGKTDNLLCPVIAMLTYLVVRGSGAGPLFKFQDGKPETCGQAQGGIGSSRSGPVSILRAQLQEWGGHNSSKAGHWGGYNKDAGQVEE